ncbi:MAG: ChaN family lipoprotein [bacterium]|nr:ChaN family lipoprotein [bacterium]
MKNTTTLLTALMLALASCAGTGHRIVHAPTGADLELAAMADALASADVVFLGEKHDSDVAHDLQMALTRALAERRGEVAISMEMLERDVQEALDAYLDGEIDEERFLEESRPWPNYAEHYRPAVEFAKERGFDVIAANCPRPLAAKVSKEGLDAVRGDPHVAAEVDVSEAAYRERFLAAMDGHGGVDEENLNRMFAAQCIKDDTMAESIARYLDLRGANAPIVVHWCGSFHSDFGLGTVSRLRARKPELEARIVTTVPSEELDAAFTAEDEGIAEYVWLVPE